MTVYAQHENPPYGAVSAGIWAETPQQAMLLEKVLIEAMANYSGKPEQTVLAKWHRETVSMLQRSKDERWAGWEDHYPLAFKQKVSS